MTTARWTQVKTLFEAALEHPPGERDAFLESACSGDADLLAEVRSLLDADEDLHPMFDTLALEAIALPPDLFPTADALLDDGDRVGPYRLVRRLGMGGMGAVYLAERADDEFEQQVALKLVKRGMDTEAVLARFRAERQILARLEHPHIARLLDGGVEARGRPYFAMEYVDGVPITDYCDAHALSIEDRLWLFEGVCEAVAYAHQNLVVHRDMKPSNTLVTQKGTVKLLDFGIAKLLAGDDNTALTRTGQRVLTPAYAAPEQIQEQAITTATDVYGLGVVLYELLAGRRPFDNDGRRALEAAILRTDPVRPSTAAVRATDETTDHRSYATQVAQQRSTTPDRLQRQLRGDLDTIVLRALHKDAARRYSSAEGLLSDLRAFRQNRPVAARPDAWSYRLRKYVQRHRAGVLTGAAVLVLVAALVGFYTARLAAERDRAQQEADKAEQVVAFMEGLFESSDPSEALGDTLTVRQVMDDGATRLREELAAQPAIRARMLDVIAGVYQNLRLDDEAAPLLQEAIQDWRQLGSEGALGLAESLNKQGRLYGEKMDFEAAEAAYEEAITLRELVLGTPHADVAELYNNLGLIKIRRGDYPAAESLLQYAIEMERDLPSAPDEDFGAKLFNLAYIKQYQGEFEEAEAMYRESLELLRQAYGDVHPHVMLVTQGLAGLLGDRGKLAEADATLQQVLVMGRDLMGPTSIDYAFILKDLARIRAQRERYEEAIALHKEAVDLIRTTYNDEPHTYVALAVESFGIVYFQAEQYEESAQMYREALAMRRQLFDEPNADISNNLGNLGLTLRRMGRYTEAEALYRQALAIDKEIYGAQHREIATVLHNIAQIRHELGDHEEARALHLEALTMRRDLFEEAHPHIAVSLTSLGSLEQEQNNVKQARRYFEEALTIQRALHDDEEHAAVIAAQERLESVREALSD